MSRMLRARGSKGLFVLDVAFAIPGAIDTPTGGYGYDRRLMALLPGHGIRVHPVTLPGSFPSPSAADLVETWQRLAAVSQAALLLIDGLAYGALPASLIRGIRSPIVALVHHPLALETGLSEERRRLFCDLEREALALARHAIVTSASTADVLVSEFGVARGRITAAEPGTDPAPRARGSGHPVRLLSVGAVVPRKGYDVLVSALAHTADLSWQARIVGSLDRAPEHAARVRDMIEQAGLGGRVTLAGPLDADALAAEYDLADLFVLPSWHEGFGMVLTEAMARGLPIIATTGGASGATLPDRAGVKIMPGDVDALGATIRRLVEDGDARRCLGDGAWEHAKSLPRWFDTAARVAGALRGVAQAAAPG